MSDGMRHVPVVCGWDQVDNGWFLECTCGETFGPSLYMEEIGSLYDDHMRELGILIEE